MRKPDAFVTKACPQCGREFRARARRQVYRGNTYCSKECFAEVRKVEGARWRDREQIRVYMADYSERNREQLNARRRAYFREHPEYRRRKGETNGITAEQWQRMRELAGFACLACGRREPDVKLCKDHVIPYIAGGSNQISNIQPLCASCNSRKCAQSTDYRIGTALEGYGREAVSLQVPRVEAHHSGREHKAVIGETIE